MDMTKFSGSESKYLKAADLSDGKGGYINAKAVISSVALVEFENEGVKETKPALSMVGKEKAVVCNATSVLEMITAWGPDSESWINKEIGLSVKHYENFGKSGIVITALGKEFVDDDCPF